MPRLKSVHEPNQFVIITKQQEGETIALYNRLDEVQKEKFRQEWKKTTDFTLQKKTTDFTLQKEKFTKQLEQLSQQQYQTLITSLNLILVLYCPSSIS